MRASQTNCNVIIVLISNYVVVVKFLGTKHRRCFSKLLIVNNCKITRYRGETSLYFFPMLIIASITSGDRPTAAVDVLRLNRKLPFIKIKCK